MMIRVTILYPNKPDAKFDYDYYVNKHVKTANEKFARMGMVKAEIDKGISGMQAGSPPPYVAMGHMVFNSIEDFQKAFEVYGDETAADGPNYTNIEPQIQISEIVM
jgi:uncharacterized protein (TIGR02118 family)